MSKKSGNGERILVGRDTYLSLLDKPTNLCIIGEKGIGKTALLKEFIRKTREQKQTLPIYVDFEKISLSPEDFCVEFIATILHQTLGGNYTDYTEIEKLEKIKDKLGKGAEIIDKVKNELEKISPNQQLLLELAFKFTEAIGEKNTKKIVLCMDEFWRILDLNNYSRTSDVISLFKNVSSTHSYTNYTITGSAAEITKEIARKLEIKVVELGKFEKRDTKELATGIADKDIELIQKLSNGIPYAVSVLTEKYGEEKDVKKIFLKEMLEDKGILYNFYTNYLNESLGRARGKSLLWVILKKLSVKDMKLSEASKAIHRSSAVTKNLLSRLTDVDLIAREGNVYTIKNKLLKYFINKTSYGYKSIEELYNKVEEEV